MSPQPQPAMLTERRAIIVTGVVQGVGFRPFVHRLAGELGLSGFVRNDAGDVRVEAEGAPSALANFETALRESAPPRARIARVKSQRIDLSGQPGFTIQASECGVSPAPYVAPDSATCKRCLEELFSLGNRRFQYPFLNCTDCGPRFTIIDCAPYDRERTTLRGFAWCPACRAEYDDPSDRRFHAEASTCPACGPKLELVTRCLDAATLSDPLAGVVATLSNGGIAAIKGLGGFHLACLASDEAATSELRRRKGRDEKPFALMVSDRARALELCELNEAESDLLESPERPIVLARRRPHARVARAVAGSSPLLGIMLPYTPSQHLLCRRLSGAALVMTSGNASHEPIAFEEGDARARLSPIADCLLTDDRPIQLRCDDSVVRQLNGARSTLSMPSSSRH